MQEMKSECERCNAVTDATGTAFICSYECTFCQNCTDAFEAVFPNCSGELVRRPTRVAKATESANS